ncbi:sodium/calcium exchanger protein-like protein [Dothidotthia symphoricarpi CBS 119687]|uniref:Sodium/calcium exchanger protein-like protein n=1 Tax=Dothidotthia symphoricarpi CBS 119687 TaxID=1392245 RepID=A0A6A6AQW0_9PLEO|nr:sodium/calcium exchanger protein-like protein [Dothidotthia symphoricarpi CBS 119687]KAF2133926.1 sodium/calcium exchanger protein-like protein [Dothidotthia symphoricarpi CBS 119687]
MLPLRRSLDVHLSRQSRLHRPDDAMNPRTFLDTVHTWRRPRYSARPFALTLLAVSLIALLAWAKDARAPQHGSPGLLARDLAIVDEECRLVHHAVDKCAFVRANCPDEEAGVVSYLSFYYCRLPHAKPVAFTVLALWLGVLFSTIGIAASDFFCVNLNTISGMLGMSESLAGVTLLALGNGSPDVFSTFAAFRTHAASLAIGELIGAASFITAVVAGSMALIRPFNVARRSFVRDVGFFIVAAAFSMGFIADGELHLWESVTMVAFYLFYVVFVVAWHWWLNQRRARRLKTAAMRSQYVMPGGDEEDVPQYHDDEETPATPGARTPVRGMSEHDFLALERAGTSPLDADENEEDLERWMGEMTNNMRVSRPPIGLRRSTYTPIRPSLVGALEFRAVLSSLQKSRNIQSMPINLRRYSDDPTYTTVQQQDLISTASDPAPRPPFAVASTAPDTEPRLVRPGRDIQHNMGHRIRAVSTNDLDSIRLDPSSLHSVPHITFGPATPDARRRPYANNMPPLSPTISLSPPPSQHSSRAPSLLPHKHRHRSPDRLAPPHKDSQGLSPVRQGTTTPSPLSSPILEPGQHAQPPNLKLAVHGTASPPIPFPAYTDYPFLAGDSSRPPSLHLPPPSASPQSSFHKDSFGARDVTKTPRWWPSNVFPPPHILLSTLFPTMTNWADKSFWDKLLGVVAGLPVFLLTITLPVVEPQKDEDDVDDGLPTDFGLPPPLTPAVGSLDTQHRSPLAMLAAGGSFDSTKAGIPQTHRGSISAATSPNQPPQVFITAADNLLQSPEQLPTVPSSSEPNEWNRWLVIVQTFTAPWFIVLVVWVNFQPEDVHALLRHTLYSLVASLCMLAFILVTTSPNRPPRWRSLLCFLGFVVAIAWISTIANEVVGVLRTLGVVLNMSDAILGLTIFAVGNSLGDLVADITVARLGFPVMALSACIGLSGSYMILTKGEHRHEKHPHQPVKFRPYHIVVSTTLIVSGATLLVTLAGLLVAVIGWGLVTLWVVLGVGNDVK